MVAMNVWPTDASDGSVASEARWRKMGRLWMPTGVAVAAAGASMAPTLAYPNLTVKAGSCWVDGHFCELPGDQVLAVTANGIAVVRFDPAANTAQLLYLDGVTAPAQSPTGTFELPVARISGSALVDARGLLMANGNVEYLTATGRDLNRPIPIGGERCSIRIGPGEEHLDFEYRDGVWKPKGVVFLASVASNFVVGPDATWVTVPYTNIVKNLGNGYNGTYWLAQYPGLVKVTASVPMAVGTTAGNTDAVGVYSASLSVFTNSANAVLASINAQLGLATLTGSIVTNVVLNQNFYPQVWINGAAGKNKTVLGNIGSISIEYI